MVIISSRSLLTGLLLALPAFARVPGYPRGNTLNPNESLFTTETPQVSEHQFSKRELTYDQAVTKGCQKLNWLQGSQAIDQSVFTDVSALEDNGWEQEEPENGLPSDLEIAFQALGYSTAAEDNVGHEVIQGEEGETTQAYGGIAAGAAYGASGGDYTNFFNKKDGVIMATDNVSPQHSLQVAYPPLTKYSDVTWLTWKGFAGDQVANINYYFRVHIVEQSSVPVIDQVLQRSTPSTTLDSLGDWPGLSYGMDTDLGKALLGTPNGAGTAFFLGQHQAQLGRLTIQSANVFKTELNGGSYRNIAFKIVPVTA